MPISPRQQVYLYRTGLHVQNLIKGNVDPLDSDEIKLLMAYRGKIAVSGAFLIKKYSAQAWDYVDKYLASEGFKM